MTDWLVFFLRDRLGLGTINFDCALVTTAQLDNSTGCLSKKKPKKCLSKKNPKIIKTHSYPADYGIGSKNAKIDLPMVILF